MAKLLSTSRNSPTLRQTGSRAFLRTKLSRPQVYTLPGVEASMGIMLITHRHSHGGPTCDNTNKCALAFVIQ